MLSFLQRSSNGTAQTSVRDAYRQRLQEIAASTLVPSTSALGRAGAEAGPSGALPGLDRQVSLDRDRLRAALGNLDSLAGNVQSLDAEFGQIRELCRAVQERIRTQAETVAALEQTVRSQAELIETRVKAALLQASERFEALTLALDAHAEAVGEADTVIN